MADFSAALKKHWSHYQAELDTGTLVAAIISHSEDSTLGGDDLWNLLRLTWITNADDHWRSLKIPALANLFGKQARVMDDLDAAIVALNLPEEISKAARRETGFVNFRNVWRNSSRHWCQDNVKELRRIVRDSVRLGPNDQDRFNLARRVQELPPIPAPSSTGHSAGAGILLTPLVACIDPKHRFPVINGRPEVGKLLASFGLSSRNLTGQVKGLVGLIGDRGISDALMIDVLAEEIANLAPTFVKQQSKDDKGVLLTEANEGLPLHDYDEAERTATIASGTTRYRTRHNTMTKALGQLCRELSLKAGTHANCRYDVLAKNYDGDGRDLLVEVKPDPDKGSLRIAIGQLLDYRRFLPNRAGTDLAVLTISTPPEPYLNLLLDLQITALWFVDANCTQIKGTGKAWEAFERTLTV